MMVKFFMKTDVFCQNKNQVNLRTRFHKMNKLIEFSRLLEMTIPVLVAVVVIMLLAADAMDNVLEVPSVVADSDSGAAD